MRRTRLPRSFAGHPAPPFLSSPAGTAEANPWLVSCRDAHARPLALGPSWAWTAVLQQLPGFVALVRCGRCACAARLGGAQRPSCLGAVPRMAGLQSQLCKHGGNGWPDSAPPQVSLLFTAVQTVGYLPPRSVWGDAPQCGFMAPHGSLPLLFTPWNWHHWQPAAWAV